MKAFVKRFINFLFGFQKPLICYIVNTSMASFRVVFSAGANAWLIS